MGDLNKRIAKVQVVIGGIDQAKEQMKQMEEVVKKLRKEIEAAEDRKNKAVHTPQFDDAKAELAELEKQYKRNNKALTATKQNIKTVEEYLQDISGQTLRNLNAAKKSLNQMLLGINPKNVDALDTVRGFIKQLGDEALRRKGALVEFKDVIDDIGSVSDQSLGNARKRLEELISITGKNDAVLGDYRTQLQRVREEEDKRKAAFAEEVMDNLSGSSVTEIREAVKVTEQLRDAQSRGNSEWVRLNQQIQDANNHLAEFSRRAIKDDMVDRFKRLGEASTASLIEQKKYWQEQADGARHGTDALGIYLDKVKAIQEEERKRVDVRVGKVMGNLAGSSVAEIREAVKVTEQLRDAQSRGSQEWGIYNREIQSANAYLEEYAKQEKWMRMEDSFQNLSRLSDSAFEEQKKYWQGMAAGAEKGSKELSEYKQHLNEIARVEKSRDIAKVNKVMSNLDAHSDEEIKETIKLLEKLRDGEVQGNILWKQTDEGIKNATKHLERYAKAEKEAKIVDTMKNLGTASHDAMEEAKKFWQEQADGADLSDAKLKQYKMNLESIRDEEELRIGRSARQTMSEVKGGSFFGTIGETKEAIKLLEKYKQTLNVFDVTGLKDVDETLEILNGHLEKAKGNTLSFEEAIKAAGKVSDGTFDGTIEDVEKLKKNLLQLRSATKVTDKEKLAAIDKALGQISDKTEGIAESAVDVQKVINNIKTAKLDDLKAAAAKLQKELAAMETNEDGFVNKSADLRHVNKRIRDLTRSWEEHQNQIQATIKRLASYVMVYAGFNEIWGKTKQFFSANLELSDSMADIRKTTGMTTQAVAELSAAIDEIDTRTSQKELHDLAYEAGKLGLKAKDDVLSFVKAGNQLIAALGEDLGGAEAVRSLMKINDLLGETSRLGVEKALLATGSAMNELSQSSTASAGPIADIVARLGAVGAQSKLTMADLLAIGSAADSLSQDAEVVGTAMSKFITAMQTNTHSIAQAVGLDDKNLEQLMKGGHMMEAIIDVLERLGEMGTEGMQNVAPLMKEFGSDGERLKTVVNALGKNVDVLRKHVLLSNEAFREATSVTNEYNIKNESSRAIVERMGNSIKEYFVNSTNEGAIHKVLQTLSDIPAVIERNAKAFITLTSAVTGLTAAVIASSLGWGKFNKKAVQAMFSLKGLKAGLQSVTTALSQNWLAIVIGAVTALGTAFYRLATYVSDSAKAMAEHAAELEKEKMEVEALFMGLRNLNTTTEERAKLIAQINDKYGEYLGFMLRETDSSDKLAAAQELINAKIRERITLKLKEKMTDSTTQKYGDVFRDSLQEMAKGFGKSRGVGEARSQKAMEIVQRAVAENISKPVKEIMESVSKGLAEKFDNDYGDFGTRAFDEVEGDIKDYVKAQKAFRAEMKSTENFVKNEMKMAQEETVKSTMDMLTQLNKEYAKFQKDMDTAQTDADKNKARSNMLARAKDYIKLAENVKDKVGTDALGTLNKEMDRFKKSVEELTPKTAKFINIWGEGMELDKATVNQLVAKYEELFEERKTLHEKADYKTIYSAQFADRKEAMDWYMDQLTIIKKRLNEMGYNEHGGFLKPGKGGRKGEHEAKEQVNAALAALEAWYNREQQLITRSYMEREITEEEYHRRSLDKEKEFLMDRIKLRKKLLGKPGGENFDPSKYVHTDSDTGEVTEYFKGKDLNKLSKFLKKFGDGMIDGMFKQQTEDELKIFQRAVEHIQKIQKILLDNDFTAQVDKQYQDELEKLDLFWSRYEDVEEDHADTRLQALKALVQEAYSLDAKGLEERIKANTEFSDWQIGRTAEDYQALLIMLQKYYDDVEEAENREIARKQRISDKKWKKDGIKGQFDDAEHKAENGLSFAKDLQDMGILDQSSVDDAEISLYKARKTAAEEYYAFILENGGNLQEAEAKREEASLALQEAEMEAMKHKMETLKQYTDAVVDFSEQMGEAAFGEVADRKAAAKQLLQTTMKLTKDLIMEQIKRLIMHKTMKQQELVAEQSTEAAKTMIHGTSTVSELTVEGAKTVATTEMGIVQGSAKTIGKLGWWGIPLIAVISAALSALMGLAMGKMNKAKKEVQAVTGAGNAKGKVAAGMLTYASGDYPVLGNDGKVYNATYHDKLQTGVYSGGNGRAHFGIFSEKEPEMIVDGKTTRKLIVDYPALYDSILTIARHGRLRESSMPTYAEGSYPMPQPVSAADGSMQGEQMAATLAMLADTVQQLKSRLDQPINAVVDPYGKKGGVNQLRKAEKFMRQTGQIP